MQTEEANIFVRREEDFCFAGKVKRAVDFIFFIKTRKMKFDIVMRRLGNSFAIGCSWESPVVVVFLLLLADICGFVNASSVVNPWEGD